MSGMATISGKRWLTQVLLGIACVLPLLGVGEHLWANCMFTEPVKKRRIVVLACEQVKPETVPRLKEYATKYPKRFIKPDEDWIKKDVARVLASYRGAWITARDVRVGTTRTQAGIRYEQHYLFQTEDIRSCEQFPKDAVLDVTTELACCDGDPNPPCFLDPGGQLLRSPRFVK